MTELNTIIKAEKTGPFFHNGTSGAAKNVSLSQLKYRTVPAVLGWKTFPWSNRQSSCPLKRYAWHSHGW